MNHEENKKRYDDAAKFDPMEWKHWECLYHGMWHACTKEPSWTAPDYRRKLDAPNPWVDLEESLEGLWVENEFLMLDGKVLSWQEYRKDEEFAIAYRKIKPQAVDVEIADHRLAKIDAAVKKTLDEENLTHAELVEIIRSELMPVAADIENIHLDLEGATKKPLPKIGEPLGSGIFAGLSKGENGEPDAALILLPDTPDKMNWKDAVALGETLGNGAHLPSRSEGALLHANLREQFKTDDWYWLGTQSSEGSAWGQLFTYGGQLTLSKDDTARCRFVRRLATPEMPN